MKQYQINVANDTWRDCQKAEYDATQPRLRREMYLVSSDELYDALKALHTLVIKKNCAGTDWGDLFQEMLIAVSMADQALHKKRGEE